MEVDLSHYDMNYYLTKKAQYEGDRAWKVKPFFRNLQVKDKTVLDYGSAAGNMAIEATRHQARAVFAYDPIYDEHPEIVAAILSPGINYVTTGQLQKFEEKFDLIFCSDVIEHIVPGEVTTFIANLVRVTHEKSIICLNTPVKINLAWIIGKPLASASRGHINVMSPWQVIKLFKMFDFHLIEKPFVRGISKNKLLQHLENLPYPLNSIWGGHCFFRFSHRTR